MKKNITTEITPREKQGMEAIIRLQAVGGIKESKEKALAGWRGMSEHNQDFTLQFFAAISAPKEAK